MSGHAEPVGGRLLTGPMKFLLVVVAVGVAMMVWRFASGIGAVSGLSDGYPWGIWIAFDVVTGTALACGGYAVAILVYILNRARFHPLMRSAILTSALGYSLASVGIVVDVGRYWNLYKLPISWGKWNLNSILLEVALCVMAYIVVLWIEMAPVFLERWQQSGRPGLARFAARVSPALDKALIWIIALGLLLPTMHQSSLGGVMLLGSHKMHPLWQTPLLPLLFLISCIAMGFGVVVMESSLSARVFRRPRETAMLSNLARIASWLLFLYVALRIGDIALRGRLGALAAMDGASILFLVEMLLFLLPAFLLQSRSRREAPGCLFRGAFMIVLAGSLYRFSTYLITYHPGPSWSYFPTVPELLITTGLVALEIVLYIVIVKRYPILAAGSSGPQLQGGTR